MDIEPQGERVLTNRGVEVFLRSRAKEYLQKLEEFGRKCEDGLGFQKIFRLTSKSYPLVKAKQAVSPMAGEFTCAGLCEISSSICEEALIRRFKDQIEVASYWIYVKDRDLYPLQKLRSLPSHPEPHYILRFKCKGDNEYVTVDATFRQFHI